MQEELNTKTPKKAPHGGVTIKTAVYIAVLLVAVLISVMLTFALTVNYLFRGQSENDEFYKKFDVISQYINDFAYYDADVEGMQDAALKAFAAGAGDRYTVYYNAEDFKALNEDNEGRYVGIGVTVSATEVEYMGRILSLLEIINVVEGSPASEAGLLTGDMIYSVYVDGEEILADDVGMDVMTSKIKGEEGTEVTIAVLRKQDGEMNKLDFTLQRRKVEVKSVTFATDAEESDVGIVTISQFDLNTPTLFYGAVSQLLDEGINKIVIDMRNNGGGDLNSVVACASYFLNEDDLIISAEDNEGNVVKYKARARTYGGSYAACSVAKEDIGVFKDVKAVILVNENTASAAELLTAVFRDYKLAPIVGVNTFGKGTMQTIYSLEAYGIDGGIKITTDVYFPPCGENYDGVGILPDIVVKPQECGNDNQLRRAVEELKK